VTIMAPLSLIITMLSLPMILGAPLTDKEVKNRVVAISKSTPELLRAAVSPHYFKEARMDSSLYTTVQKP